RLPAARRRGPAAAGRPRGVRAAPRAGPDLRLRTPNAQPGRARRPDRKRSRDVRARRLSRRRSGGRGHAAYRGALVPHHQRRTDGDHRGRSAARRMDGAARRGVAAVRRAGIIHVAPLLLAAACGKLQGFDGEATPLVSFQVVFHGDLAPLRPPGVTDTHALRVALVWGAQWLTEPFCVLPPESPEAAAVIAAGCRDPVGLVSQVVSVGAITAL